jgi:hypothetical protein
VLVDSSGWFYGHEMIISCDMSRSHDSGQVIKRPPSSPHCRCGLVSFIISLTLLFVDMEDEKRLQWPASYADEYTLR